MEKVKVKVNQFRKDGDLVISDEDQFKVHLHIEHTRSPEEQYMGLRFRKELPAQAGMTFLTSYKGWFTMVMEDTYIPLDMIFINHMGVIADIIKDIPALFPEPITPHFPGCHVLEVNAGLCEEQRIQIGDNVNLHIPGYFEDPDWDVIEPLITTKTQGS